LKSVSEQISWEAAVLWLKSRPEHVDLVRHCFYDDPLKDAADRYFESSEWRAVRDLIGTRGGSALDLGSGRGISAYALARDGWQTTALEPDSSDEIGAGAIRGLAASTGLSIAVVEKWGEKLPFSSNSFDLVHCRQVLHHARDLQQFCCEAARVLKPNGKIIATREHVISRAEDLPVFLKNHPLHHLYGGENAFTLGEYLDALVKAGIHLTKVLNPLDSDINLYPETLERAKLRIAKKFRVPSFFVGRRLLSWRGASMTAPGRLYSFFGYRADQA
jgi:SAM-dependent methyltransferase